MEQATNIEMERRTTEYKGKVADIIALLNSTEQTVRDAIALRDYWQPAEMGKVAELWNALEKAKKAYAEGLAQLPL